MRKTAILGGLGYVVIFITGIFANFLVLEELKVAGDNAATFENIQNNSDTFIWAIVAFIIMVIFDIILTWALYRIFKEQNARKSGIASWLRLINALFFGAALIYLFQVLYVVQNEGASETAIAEVASSLESFNNVWLIGLLFFGAHLMMLSSLLCRSQKVKQLIPGLLMLAGLGYLFDTMLQFFYADYANIANISAFVVVLPGVLGELSLTVWLLVKAGRKESVALKTL